MSSPAMQAFEEVLERAVAQDFHWIIKRRARNMIAGILPLRFCQRAACIVARYRRRQHTQRKAA